MPTFVFVEQSVELAEEVTEEKNKVYRNNVRFS